MKPVFQRIVAFPKDIQIITGKGERYARSTYVKIKAHYNKLDHQLLTLDELASYYGLPLQKLQEILPE